MASLLVLELLFPFAFLVRGFAKAQDGKINTFPKKNCLSYYIRS